MPREAAFPPINLEKNYKYSQVSIISFGLNFLWAKCPASQPLVCVQSRPGKENLKNSFLLFTASCLPVQSVTQAEEHAETHCFWCTMTFAP